MGSETTYEIVHILDERTKPDGTLEFRVRWKNYTPADDTWEPPEMLDHGEDNWHVVRLRKITNGDVKAPAWYEEYRRSLNDQSESGEEEVDESDTEWKPKKYEKKRNGSGCTPGSARGPSSAQHSTSGSRRQSRKEDPIASSETRRSRRGLCAVEENEGTQERRSRRDTTDSASRRNDSTPLRTRSDSKRNHSLSDAAPLSDAVTPPAPKRNHSTSNGAPPDAVTPSNPKRKQSSSNAASLRDIVAPPAPKRNVPRDELTSSNGARPTAVTPSNPKKNHTLNKGAPVNGSSEQRSKRQKTAEDELHEPEIKSRKQERLGHELKRGSPGPADTAPPPSSSSGTDPPIAASSDGDQAVVAVRTITDPTAARSTTSDQADAIVDIGPNTLRNGVKALTEDRVAVTSTQVPTIPSPPSSSPHSGEDDDVAVIILEATNGGVKTANAPVDATTPMQPATDAPIFHANEDEPSYILPPSRPSCFRPFDWVAHLKKEGGRTAPAKCFWNREPFIKTPFSGQEGKLIGAPLYGCNELGAVTSVCEIVRTEGPFVLVSQIDKSTIQTDLGHLSWHLFTDPILEYVRPRDLERLELPPDRAPIPTWLFKWQTRRENRPERNYFEVGHKLEAYHRSGQEEGCWFCPATVVTVDDGYIKIRFDQSSEENRVSFDNLRLFPCGFAAACGWKCAFRTDRPRIKTKSGECQLRTSRAQGNAIPLESSGGASSQPPNIDEAVPTAIPPASSSNYHLASSIIDGPSTSGSIDPPTVDPTMATIGETATSISVSQQQHGYSLNTTPSGQSLAGPSSGAIQRRPRPGHAFCSRGSRGAARGGLSRAEQAPARRPIDDDMPLAPAIMPTLSSTPPEQPLAGPRRTVMWGVTQGKGVACSSRGNREATRGGLSRAGQVSLTGPVTGHSPSTAGVNPQNPVDTKTSMIEHPYYAPPDTIDVSNNLLAANEIYAAADHLRVAAAINNQAPPLDAAANEVTAAVDELPVAAAIIGPTADPTRGSPSPVQFSWPAHFENVGSMTAPKKSFWKRPTTQFVNPFEEGHLLLAPDYVTPGEPIDYTISTICTVTDTLGPWVEVAPLFAPSDNTTWYLADDPVLLKYRDINWKDEGETVRVPASLSGSGSYLNRLKKHLSSNEVQKAPDECFGKISLKDQPKKEDLRGLVGCKVEAYSPHFGKGYFCPATVVAVDLSKRLATVIIQGSNGTHKEKLPDICLFPCGYAQSIGWKCALTPNVERTSKKNVCQVKKKTNLDASPSSVSMGATFPLQAITKKEQKVARKRRKKNGEQSGVEMPKRQKGRPLGAQTLQKALEQMIRKGETNALLAAAKKAHVIKNVSHKVPTTSSSIDHFASTINDLPTSGSIDPPTVDRSIATARDEGAVTSGVSIQNGYNLETKDGPLAARKRRVNKEQGDAPKIPKRRGRPTKEAKKLREAAGLNQSDVIMGEQTSVNGAVIIGDHASSDVRQPQVPPQSQLPTDSGSSMEIALQGQQLQRNASHHQNHNSSTRSSSRPLPMIAKVRLAPPRPLPSRQQEWTYIKERKEQISSTIATARGDTATTAETVESGGTQLSSSTSAIIAHGGQQQSPIRPPYTIVAGESQSPMQPRSSNPSVISRAVPLQPGELQMQPPPSVRPQVVALTPSSGSEEASSASPLRAHARTSGTSSGAPISIAELAAAAQRRVLQQQVPSRPPPPPTPAEQLPPILRTPNGVQESSSVQRHQVPPQQRLPSRLPPRHAEQLSPIMRVPTDDGAGSLAAQANTPGSSGAFPIDNVQLQAQFVQLQAHNEQMQQQMQKMQQMLQQVLHAGVANGAGPLGAQQSAGHVAPTQPDAREGAVEEDNGM